MQLGLVILALNIGVAEMPDVMISGANTSAEAVFETDEAFPYAQTLATLLSEGLENGSLTPLNYTSGAVAPGAAGGVVVITTAPTTTVTIPTTDVGLFITAGPTTITGGAAGETVIGGSSGLTYTDITPSSSAVDYIAVGDGANFITTSLTGTGNYQIDTGAGNDTISVFGNGAINAGTGFNSISVSGGSSLIYSEGGDNITAAGDGTDTVDIGTGRATINPGSANLDIFEDSDATNPLFVAPGTGSDTVSVGAGGGTVYGGSGGNSTLIAGAGALYGGGTGDQLYATGSAQVVLTAGSGTETLSGAGGTLNGKSFSASSADDIFMAGSGNDTITGGSGNDTVVFAGPRADYALTVGPDGTLLVTGIGGGFAAVDTLSDIETLAFADETQAPCYCLGTLILTDAGETAVEALAIGDTVITASGMRPVRWIGRRSYAGRFLAANPHVQPIRFRAASLGGGLPSRDLLVSPEHAMFLDGLLIPARCLVNGSTILRERGLDRVDYFHVELDTHDVLLAEGAPSESFMDDHSRGMFHNASEFAALYPDAARPGGFCARRVEQGAELEAIRRRLAVVAGELAQAA